MKNYDRETGKSKGKRPSKNAKSLFCKREKMVFRARQHRFMPTALSYRIVAIGAVLTHNVTHAQFLMRALLSSWVRMVWLVFLIVKILVVSLDDAPHQQGHPQKEDKSKCYIHCDRL